MIVGGGGGAGVGIRANAAISASNSFSFLAQCAFASALPKPCVRKRSSFCTTKKDGSIVFLCAGGHARSRGVFLGMRRARMRGAAPVRDDRPRRATREGSGSETRTG